MYQRSLTAPGTSTVETQMWKLFTVAALGVEEMAEQRAWSMQAIGLRWFSAQGSGGEG